MKKFVQVSKATADLQIILEVSATDIRATLKTETMALPQLSQAMGYTTRKTVNCLARRQIHFNHVEEA